ncbi:MAG: GMC oxidoreductase, partial [Pseudomonadota bacterium]
RDKSDLDIMVAGVSRLRRLLDKADFAHHRGVEVHPGPSVEGEALRDFVRSNAGTAYHPVGTLALGGPVSSNCAVRGTQGLWVADASVMPQVTSANTNAPSMMIGWKAAEMIAKEVA